jgi:hypothetical protein
LPTILGTKWTEFSSESLDCIMIQKCNKVYVFWVDFFCNKRTIYPLGNFYSTQKRF